MGISPIIKRNIYRILPFGLIWLIFACLFLWIEYAAIGDQANTPEAAIKISSSILVFALSGITLIGLLIGCIEILFLNRLFAKQSFIVKIISKFFIYMCFFFLMILINYPIAASIELNTSILDEKVWDKYTTFFFSLTHVSAIIQLTFSLLISLLYSEISENLGQNILLNFFTGKYHHPKSESRVFMFVDMKSSTSIAEQLGHIEYFTFLRSYYYDLANAIVKNHGEVYQYIGDEIVISWKLQKGIQNNNCVKCFFDMKKDLFLKKESYLKRYKIFPEFKAALHCGEVTTGEIGALKKEIFFTGDVLNTTARIQSLCNTYNTELLISEQLKNQLNVVDNYVIKALSEHQVKGKSELVAIFSVQENGF